MKLFILIVTCIPLYVLTFIAFYSNIDGFIEDLFKQADTPTTTDDYVNARWAIWKLVGFILVCTILTCGVKNMLSRWL